MRTREPYVVELANTVNEMFKGGNFDPSAKEIAEAHFPNRALGGEIVDGIRKRLHRVRDVLEKDFEYPVYLLSHNYYSRFRHSAPKTETEARRCIPGGPGISMAGLRLQTEGDEDLIWQAMVAQNYSSGAGKVKKQTDRVLEAVQDHRLGKPRAARLIDGAHRQAQPNKAALQERVLKTLPEGKRARAR